MRSLKEQADPALSLAHLLGATVLVSPWHTRGVGTYIKTSQAPVGFYDWLFKPPAAAAKVC